MLARFIARSIAYPGSTKSLQKDYSVDYVKRLITQLESFANVSVGLSATFMLLLSEKKVPNNNVIVLEGKLIELLAVADSLSILSQCVSAAYNTLYTTGSLTQDEITQLSAFTNSLSTFSECILEFAPIALKSIRDNSIASSSTSKNSAISNGNKVSSPLLLAAGRCFKASEALKEATIQCKPKKQNNNDSGTVTGALSILGGLTQINAGAVGVEKLSFPIMREQLKRSYDAECMSLIGVDKNVIDGIMIPCIANRNKDCADSSSNMDMSIGMVLFCSPNAGVYETLINAHPENSWVGMYASLGFDVYVYNYRGYNSSTGTPSPDKLKIDGETIVHHIKTNRPNKRLIVHGESIGGLVACHIAKKIKIDLLICDRTFASLDAVAERLMGSWAAFGLRRLAFWSTDVATDYLASRCAKLILQDPNDEIIANAASLKNGISTKLLLNDSDWSLKKLPTAYTIALISNDDNLPNTDKISSLLTDANNLSSSLKEDFVAHLAACIMSIAAVGNLTSKKSKKRDCSSTLTANKGSPVNSPLKSISKIRTSSSSDAGNIEADDIELGNNDYSSDDDDDDDDDGSVNDNSINSHNAATAEGLNNTALGRLTQSGVLQGKQNGMSFLERFCSRSIRDPSLSPLEKIWLSISRIDGGSGQLLGQAVATGLDGIRAWLCSLVLWRSRSPSDPAMPAHSVSLAHALADLSMIIDNMHPSELNIDERVTFVKDALTALQKRCNEYEKGTISCVPISVCLDFPAESSCVYGVNIGVGNVIALHCGHNGWPAADDIKSIKDYIRHAGFEF